MANPPPLIVWVEASPAGILFAEGSPKVWHSGRVIDLVPMGNDRVLVGAETGGVWTSEANGNAHCFSDDWDFPDVLCLAQRIGFEPPVYLAGTAGGLYQSGPGFPDPLSTWIPLNLPPDVTSVFRIVTLLDIRTVIATDNGIWWADHQLPTPGNNQPIEWHQALITRGPRSALPFPAPISGSFSGLARTINSSTVNLCAGALTPDGTALYWGRWDDGNLLFRPARLSGIASTDPLTMQALSIASCDRVPSRAYAVCFHDVGTSRLKVFHLLRSNDGGHTWNPLPTTLNGVPTPQIDLIAAAGGMEAGGADKNISVHSEQPDRVAVSGYLSFLSDDGGSTWTVLGCQWNADGTSPGAVTLHHHVDHHVVAFSNDAPERIYMATDGGVFRADDWRDPATFTSTHNYGLRTLQFYSAAAYRNFLGSVATTSGPRGIAACGTQDNGNLWKRDDSLAVWQQSDGGDGGGNVVFGDGAYVHHSLGAVTSVQMWNELALSMGASSVIPNGPPGPTRDPMGRVVQIEPIQHPEFRNASGHLMHALGFTGFGVYGLLGNDSGGDLYWFWVLPLQLPPGESIFCVASYNGKQLLLGTTSGRIFFADLVTGLAATPTPVNGIPAMAVVNRIVFTSPTEAFGVFVPSSGSQIPIARWDGTAWQAAGIVADNPLAGQSGAAFGLDADDLQDPPVLMLSTDAKVWASGDRGITWVERTAGLPRRPHGADLRFNRGKRRWVLGTYGRSLWQAGKRKQVGVSSFIQGDYALDAEHKNFEALILDGSELYHYWKDNGDVRNGWQRGVMLTDRASAPACIIRSDYVRGADHHNFEALVLEDHTLWHFFRNNNGGGDWIRAGIVTADAIGPASLTQSDYRSDEDHGNYEALIPMSDGLWHWFRNNATGVWSRVARLTDRVGSLGCITRSNYESNPGHRNFEALVYEPRATPNDPDVLWHFYWNGKVWRRTQALTRRALGPGSLLQSDYIKGAAHQNLEALVWEREPDAGRSVIRHYFRDDQHQAQTWTSGPIVCDRAAGPASLIRSDFHSDPDHRNFEAILVEADNEAWHHWRDQSDLQWKFGGEVT